MLFDNLRVIEEINRSTQVKSMKLNSTKVSSKDSINHELTTHLSVVLSLQVCSTDKARYNSHSCVLSLKKSVEYTEGIEGIDMTGHMKDIIIPLVIVYAQGIMNNTYFSVHKLVKVEEAQIMPTRELAPLLGVRSKAKKLINVTNFLTLDLILLDQLQEIDMHKK